MTDITDDVLMALAPTGPLRAAINLGNSVLAQQGADGALKGVSVDLTNELARRLGRAPAFTAFEAAGKAFEALKGGDCDIAFLANEPARAAEIDFTPAYVLIEGTYMVRLDSPLNEPADVDRAGIRIAVGPNSAYDLYLTRTLKHATIVRAAKGGGRDMIDLFLAQKLEVAAGVRQPLEDFAKTDKSVRVMTGRFMEIRQSMALRKGRPAGLRYLKNFIEEMKASGFVADALKRSNQEATVAPAER
jgi:polar amino acid transport system substrate-binding protein